MKGSLSVWTKLTNNEVFQNMEGTHLVRGRTLREHQPRLDVGRCLLGGWIDGVEHPLALKVLSAVLLVVRLAKASKLEVGRLEDLLEAAAPEGAAIGIDGVVGGLADAAEGSYVFVGVEKRGDALVQLCEEGQYILSLFLSELTSGDAAGVKGCDGKHTSIGRSLKPTEATLRLVEMVSLIVAAVLRGSACLSDWGWW